MRPLLPSVLLAAALLAAVLIAAGCGSLTAVTSPSTTTTTIVTTTTTLPPTTRSSPTTPPYTIHLPEITTPPAEVSVAPDYVAFRCNDCGYQWSATSDDISEDAIQDMIDSGEGNPEDEGDVEAAIENWEPTCPNCGSGNIEFLN